MKCRLSFQDIANTREEVLGPRLFVLHVCAFLLNDILGLFIYWVYATMVLDWCKPVCSRLFRTCYCARLVMWQSSVNCAFRNVSLLLFFTFGIYSRGRF